MAATPTFSQKLDELLVQKFRKRPVSLPGILGAWNRYTGAVPPRAAPWPFSTIGGPLTHAAVVTGLGAGGGYLYGRYIHPLINPDADPEDTGRTGALVGGGAAALSQLPGLSFNIQRYGWGGINKAATMGLASSGIYGPRKGPGPFDHGFSAGHAREDIAYDPYLTPQQRSRLMASIPPGRGMVTGVDLVRGAAGAAIGYTGAGLLGTTLGALFGMSRPTQRKLRAAGAIAGALRNTGML